MRHRISRKRGSGLKKCLVLAGILVSFCLHAGSEMKGKFVFGAQTGWAIGFKPEFAWHYTGATAHDYELQGHLGGHVRYNLSDRFGLQLNFNFQDGAYHWTCHPWGGGETKGTENFSIYSYSLYGVLDFARLKGGRLYLLGGAGIGNANNTYHFDESFFLFSGGMGVRIYLSRKERAAVNLGAAYHHLWDPSKEYSDHHASLVRFTIGIEFVLNN